MVSISIDSILGDLGWLENKKDFRYPALNEALRFFRTFLICAKSWSSDVYLETGDNNEKVSLGFFLLSIEDTIQRNAPDIQPLAVQLTDDASSRSILEKEISSFHKKIELFIPRIQEAYITFSDCSCESGYQLKHDELERFIESLLDNLVDLIIYVKYGCLSYPEELFAGFEEQLRFVKNFIRFATWQGVEQEQLKDLFTHFQVVAFQAARLTFLSWIDKDQEEEISNELESLMKKIKLTEPLVGETCIHVLKATRPSGSSPAQETGIEVTVDFVDSLLDKLWELLNCNNGFVTSVENQIKMIYEELRLLRTFLGEQGQIFDELHEDLNDLIGAVVKDAGVVICSFFMKKKEEGSGKEIVLAISDLQEKIKLTKLEAAKKHPVTSRSDFPSIDELGFINSLLENLEELESSEVDLIAFPKDQIQTVVEDLEFLRSFLWHVVEKQDKYDELQVLRNRVMEVGNKIKSAIGSLIHKDIPSWSTVPFVTIMEEIKLIKNEALENCEASLLHQLTDENSWQLLQKKLGSVDLVVGLDDDMETIIGHLTRGTKQLHIVSIVGMPGLGKTTLAQKVFNAPEILYHFHVRAWCNVSQKYYKKNLLLQILGDILGQLPDQLYKMDDVDLAKELYKLLKRERYLIVMDDVWDIGVWNDFRNVFTNDNDGSRILFTSRIHDVALQAKPDSKLHPLRSLTDDESLELLQKKLFLSEDHPEALSDLWQIAKNCQGLPLTIVIVAGILITLEQDRWIEVAERLSSKISGTEHCRNTLELSYRYLPHYLKPCYLYFGAFPEDQEIPMWKLVRLWGAEGFVKQTKEMSLENVAEDYIMKLSGRSLVTVVKQRLTGGVKSCRIHDLLHEFCVAKAKERNFLQLLHTYDELASFIAPDNLHRLCIYSERMHFEKSRLFCPQVRSLLFFANGYEHMPIWYNISFIFQFFKLLTVLDLVEINLGDSFPSEIEFLLHLRYLAVQGRMQSIPSSIGNLLNLETFVVEGLNGNVLLPNTIWNLSKLRHLRINGGHVGFILCNYNLDSSSVSSKLDTFSTAVLSFGQSMEKILKKFPNIRKLKCKLLKPVDSCEDYNMIMDFLRQLESLNLSQIDEVQYPIGFCFPRHLKKLTLSKFLLPWSKISVIGELPNLEVLKLLNQAFQGEEWEMAEGEFPNLKFLKLESLDIVRWTYSGDEFPPLQKLVLESCWHLEEIPTCLGAIATLEMIELRRFHYYAEKLVEDIEKEQKDMGNEDLKIIVDSYLPSHW